MQRAQYADLKVYLPNDVLVKVDRMSMQHSLEVRCPLLDRRVIELAFRIPTARKMPRLQGKFLLRQLAARRLPRELASLPKRGFHAPMGAWLAGPCAASFRDDVLAPGAAVKGLIDVGIVVVDQLTKTWAVRELADGPVELFGDVAFRLSRNSGGAFSLFQGFTPLLAVLAIVLAVVLVRALQRTQDPLVLIALALILGGAIGNLLDRLARSPGFLGARSSTSSTSAGSRCSTSPTPRSPLVRCCCSLPRLRSPEADPHDDRRRCGEARASRTHSSCPTRLPVSGSTVPGPWSPAGAGPRCRRSPTGTRSRWTAVSSPRAASSTRESGSRSSVGRPSPRLRGPSRCRSTWCTRTPT